MEKEKIQEAWGDKYSNDVIMEGRRCGFKIVDNIEYIVKYQGGDWYCEPHTFETIAFMPKGLREYLKNNGWIKIESEADLPKEDITCYFILESNKAMLVGKFSHGCFDYASRYYDYKDVTHYQKIDKPLPPKF